MKHFTSSEWYKTFWQLLNTTQKCCEKCEHKKKVMDQTGLMVLKKVTLVLLAVKNEHIGNEDYFYLLETFGTAAKQTLTESSFFSEISGSNFEHNLFRL